MFNRVTKGSLSGNAGEEVKQDWKVNGQYVDTPDQGVVGIPFVDKYVEQSGLKFLDDAAKHPDQPFFININFMKVHQPNLPAPEFKHKSLSKTKYADSVVELDARIGHIMDKLRELDLDKNTLVFYTTDNGAWQDVFPDAGYTPLRGTKGTVREGGNRVPAFAVWPGKIKPGVRNHDIVGGLDLMATFASAAGVKLPEKDRDGQPIIFDSFDMTPLLTGSGKCARNSWFYFTEDELTPGAARVGHYKAVFNLRGDDGQATGGLSVDSNLGWKGAEEVRRHGAAGFRPVARPAGTLRHLHEQLHGAHLDAGHVQPGDQELDADLHQVSAAQTPKRGLHRPDYDLGISAFPVCEGTTKERAVSTFRFPRETSDLATAILPTPITIQRHRFSALPSRETGKACGKQRFRLCRS